MKITKKENRTFHKNCETMFKNDLGAVLSTISYADYNLVVQTKIGPLYIRVDSDNVHFYSVFANFLGNEKAAKEKFGHWKQNIHKWGLSGEELIEFIKNHYLKIMNA